MGFLSEEQMSEVSNLIEGGDAGSDESLQQEEVQTAEVSSDSTEDVNEEVGSAGEVEAAQDAQVEQADAQDEHVEGVSGKNDSKWIPYERFSEVNAAKKKFQAEAAEREAKTAFLEAQLEALKKQIQDSVTPARAESSDEYDLSWLDGEDSSESTGSSSDPALSSRLEKLELMIARQEIESEISEVQAKYPDLSADELRSVVARGLAPTKGDLMRMADRHHQKTKQISDEAIARYIEGLKDAPQTQEQEAAPAAPPRARKSKSTSASTANAVTPEGKKPRNVSEATKALQAHFKSLGY